ncbi:MAG: DUF6479 family protein [Paracoccaceae bacterium]
MKPVVTGIIVAAAIIVAFVAGMQIEFRQQTPAEAFGEAVEEIAEEAEQAADEAEEAAEDATDDATQ